MEQTAEWKRLTERYGRDYGWLEKAMQLYPCCTAQDGQRAVVSFPPGEVSPEDGLAENPSAENPLAGGDFGVPYGMPPGLHYCFLLEGPSQTVSPGQEERARWAALLAETEVRAADARPAERLCCIPVKSGRPALGWQLGFSLLAIRPLALLRPFYLFGKTRPIRPEACRTVPLADTRRLGRLLEDGWLGVGCDGTGTQVTLRRPQDGVRIV